MSFTTTLLKETARVRENSYVDHTEGTCAEPGAIADKDMVAARETEIDDVAVIANGPEPITRSGRCRQRLAMSCGPDVNVTMASTGAKELTLKMSETLPGAFATHHMSNT